MFRTDKRGNQGKNFNYDNIETFEARKARYSSFLRNKQFFEVQISKIIFEGCNLYFLLEMRQLSIHILSVEHNFPKRVSAFALIAGANQPCLDSRRLRRLIDALRRT